MLFSILIPTYNNEKTIVKAIESALNQDYNDEYEIVIVNNASTDSTLSILESFNDPRIRVITNIATVHMYENHNICIKNALGDYVIFCHSDDQLLPETLKILSKKIEERMYPKRYIVWGHSMFKDYSSALQNGDMLLTYNTMFSGFFAKIVALRGGLTPSGTCYSKSMLIDLNGFPVVDGSYDMDWIFGVVAAYNACEFEMIDRILFYRIESSSYGKSINSKTLRQMKIQAAKMLHKYLTPEQMIEVKEMWRIHRFDMLEPVFERDLKYEKINCIVGLLRKMFLKLRKI